MAAGFKSVIFLLGLGKGPLPGFKSVGFPLNISAHITTAVTGGTKSYYGWWLGGFSGGVATSSPWYFLTQGRRRRNG
jgi:hypothetical protein